MIFVGHFLRQNRSHVDANQAFSAQAQGTFEEKIVTMDALLLSAHATEPARFFAESDAFGHVQSDEAQPVAAARETGLAIFLSKLGRGVVECVIPFPTRNDRLTLRESLFV